MNKPSRRTWMRAYMRRYLKRRKENGGYKLGGGVYMKRYSREAFEKLFGVSGPIGAGGNGIPE